MSDLHDAVADLIRAQTCRVHYLPGQPDTHYTVRAPCLLAQLHTAVAASSSGRGGRTVPGSRLPLAADALDLWVEILTDTHGWAQYLGVDRRPYRAAETATAVAVERVPAWTRRNWQWLGAQARRVWPPSPVGSPLPHETAPARYPVPIDDPDPLADRTVPPVGRLLRATAAQAVAIRADEVAERMAYRASGWADRIRVMLAGWTVDEHIYPIRGEQCEVCGATSVVDERDGERWRVPAVQVRFMAFEGGDPDDLWPCRFCVACGDNGWIPYRSETGAAA